MALMFSQDRQLPAVQIRREGALQPGSELCLQRGKLSLTWNVPHLTSAQGDSKPGPAVAAKDTDWVVSLCGKMEELLGKGTRRGQQKEKELSRQRREWGEGWRAWHKESHGLL